MDIYNIFTLQDYLQTIFEEMGITDFTIQDCIEKDFAIEIIYNNKKIILDEYNTIETETIDI